MAKASDSMSASAKTRATGAQVRAELGHPIIDGDGHILEFMPQVFDYVADVGGPKWPMPTKLGLSGVATGTLGGHGHRPSIPSIP